MNMTIHNLNDFKGGWVVGDFDPSLIHSRDAEVSVKHYKKDDVEQAHVHKIADEVTIIVSGNVIMNGRLLTANDIVFLPAGEPATFVALTDAITCVIKSPSIKGDKYTL